MSQTLRPDRQKNITTTERNLLYRWPDSNPYLQPDTDHVGHSDGVQREPLSNCTRSQSKQSQRRFHPVASREPVEVSLHPRDLDDGSPQGRRTSCRPAPPCQPETSPPTAHPRPVHTSRIRPRCRRPAAPSQHRHHQHQARHTAITNLAKVVFTYLKCSYHANTTPSD